MFLVKTVALASVTVRWGLLTDGKRPRSKISTLAFRKADFGLSRDLKENPMGRDSREKRSPRKLDDFKDHLFQPQEQ